jgi:alginate O-acetyltransferase complex protein AlgI
MLFNSLEFCLFFPLVWLIFNCLPKQTSKRNLLLLASLFFYGYWNWTYLILLISTSTIDFFCAKFLYRAKEKSTRKKWLLASILSNLTVLGFFKYGLFFGRQLHQFDLVANIPNWLNVLLPVGISFYTFQAMAYVIDVYRNRLKPETSFPQFLLFISFFPQLVAGPIERAPHLLGQLRNLVPIKTEKIVPALYLIMWGFWKKIFIADRLGVYVDAVFEDPNRANGLQIVIGTLFFGFQIYGDFSGYSDIARGIARFFGIDLMVNFDAPYLSGSLREFWRRWHISLSGWFRDYVFIPLGGSHGKETKISVNLLIVFILSGFWHGANWTFLLWGFWHGIGLVAERFLRKKIPAFFFNQVFVLLWIFSGWAIFRSNSIADLGILCRKLLLFHSSHFDEINLFHSNSEFLLAFLGLGILLWVEKIKSKFSVADWVNQARITTITGLSIAFLLLLLFGKFKGQDFIYFQF